MDPARKTAVDGKDAGCVIRCGEGPAEGKYLVGVGRAGGVLVVAFDAGLGTHRRIAERYGLYPLGGGWRRLDPEQRLVALSGSSGDYGAEPDRGLTARIFQLALPGYRIMAD
jgi:hypothetical protein